MSEYKTISYRMPDNHRHSIVIDVDILVPVSVMGYPQNQKMSLNAKALIDTGASRSAISSNIVQNAKLSSYERCTIRMAKGEYDSPVYTVDIMFPNKMTALNIKAAEFTACHDFDLIIGMDILRKLDIAITNAKNITFISFRSPPADEHIDFTKNL